mgnify:FL=1
MAKKRKKNKHIDINYDKYALAVINKAMKMARKDHCEFVTPEHLLIKLLDNDRFINALWSIGATNDDIDLMRDVAQEEVSKSALADNDVEPMASQQLLQVIFAAAKQAEGSGQELITVPMLVNAIINLPDSWARNILDSAISGKEGEFISCLIDSFDDIDEEQESEHDGHEPSHNDRRAPHASWKDQVLCINEHIGDHNPLIGRELELERTIQVLCRKDKNNPLHLGEPGVGKTSLIYGLASRIERGDVPERLQGSKIYEIDMGSLIAGTQYRGDFEKRLKGVLEGAAGEENAIVYIDEIHNIVGAGQTGNGSLDASNMLKPYLEGGRVRFIGATTYEEYNRNIARSKGLMRRFQTIDVPEPSVDETIKIIKELKAGYEQFHGVKYDDDALEMAVKASAKHIKDRYLPDKAIDLIDEAGAMIEASDNKANRVIDKAIIAQVLAKVARVNALDDSSDSIDNLATLEPKMKSEIFGQDAAIKGVTEAIQMSKAGLLDPGKPLASLLFVGPTGVGKTEVARVLAREMGVELVRFDMSEYVEKHTVAKLIGSPAGYVGYDDGGLLTDAVRRAPDCVLLLDEIEKAHDDIFNILLQVMDYGTLTDNKGRKAHFQNVVLIMTSNAGAQHASQASLGFASTATAGGAMLKQVKKTFKPEFINRLTDVVVFNDMSHEMADLILTKKLGELQRMLDTRNVRIKVDDDAREALLKEGYSRQYGAREMDRVIHNRVKTLLMREILYGKLQHGGSARVTVKAGAITLSNVRGGKV